MLLKNYWTRIPVHQDQPIGLRPCLYGGLPGLARTSVAASKCIKSIKFLTGVKRVEVLHYCLKLLMFFFVEDVRAVKSDSLERN